MKERRKRLMKRLVIEELERRTMLNGDPIAMQASGLSTGSYQDFYKAQVGTEIGGPGGVGMLDQPLVAAQARAIPGTLPTVLNPDMAPTASTGVGQITITTGAGTLGISSFAWPTAGPSRAGGTGNAAFGGGPPGMFAEATTDQALSELESELPTLTNERTVERKTSSRVFSFDGQIDEEAMDRRYEPVGSKD